MDIDAIEHCRRRVSEEQQLGESAATAELAERHYQVAMLYKVQLSVLQRRSREAHPMLANSAERAA